MPMFSRLRSRFASPGRFHTAPHTVAVTCFAAPPHPSRHCAAAPHPRNHPHHFPARSYSGRVGSLHCFLQFGRAFLLWFDATVRLTCHSLLGHFWFSLFLSLPARLPLCTAHLGKIVPSPLRKRQDQLALGQTSDEIISMLYDVLMVAVTCALFGAMGAALKAVDKL